MATKNPQAGSHLDGPAAFPHPASGESTAPAVPGGNQGFTPMKSVLVKKYDDRVLVHVRDEQHMRALEQEHGDNLLNADGSKYEPLPPPAAPKPVKKKRSKKATAKKRSSR